MSVDMSNHTDFVTRPRITPSVNYFPGEVPCGNRVCNTDYVYCCTSRFSTLTCCANPDPPSSSNSSKWASWIGGGIGIFVTVTLLSFFIHRKSKGGSFLKSRRSVYAPAAGMPPARRSHLADRAENDYAGTPARRPPPFPAADEEVSASIVFPVAGPPCVHCVAAPQLPPYSAAAATVDGGNPPVVVASAAPTRRMAEEQRAHAVAMDSTAVAMAQRLPSYGDSQSEPSTVAVGRLVFHTQTSRDQLLPPDGASPPDLETPVTPPSTDDQACLLGPPPAYSV